MLIFKHSQLDRRLGLIKKSLLSLTALCLSASYSLAQEQKSQFDFTPVIKQIIEQAVLPGYKNLKETAFAEEQIIKQLCIAPSAQNLELAQKKYRSLVAAWSSVEMYRIGPAIKNNRQEKLFFWPDRKSIGLRQVRKLIDTENKTAVSVESLQKKSVAVQGLLALEYVLFGKGSQELATAVPDSYRCSYGATISNAIGKTATDISDGWTDQGGYADLMYTAGPDNPIYRSKGEVIQDFLRVGSEMIQSTRDLKIQNSIKSEPGKAKPKRAPLWRSDLTLFAFQESLKSVDHLFMAGGLGSFTPRYTKSLRFELEQTNKLFAQLDATPDHWIDLVKQEKSHENLTFVLIPLNGAKYVITDLIPQELGLNLGFNSLDGD